MYWSNGKTSLVMINVTANVIFGKTTLESVPVFTYMSSKMSYFLACVVHSFLPFSCIFFCLTIYGPFLPYLSSCVDVISLCKAASERHFKIGRESNLIINVKLKWNGTKKNSFARSITLNKMLSSLVGSRCGVVPSKITWPKNWKARHVPMTIHPWKVVTPVWTNTA